MTQSEADRLIALLALEPHPEGGHYRQTFRDLSGGPDGGRDMSGGGKCSPEGRGHSTLIYFLLKAGEVSRWHRIDAAEVWHFYRGAPLELKIGKAVHLLGPRIEKGETPQAVVPPGEWQTAQSLGDYTLAGCTVAPGFAFETFLMAPEGFEP